MVIQTAERIVSPMVEKDCPKCEGTMLMGEVCSVTRNEKGQRIVSVYLTLECGSCGFVDGDIPEDYH